MIRSLYSGITGLKGFQTAMDVVGNNIANVNTPGFKGSRVSFQTTFYQMLRPAKIPYGSMGGVNPLQVGLGLNVGSIDKVMTQGAFQSTGKKTDLAIQGDGFFILTDGQNRYYTRAGGFDLDENGDLVQPSSGLKVLGWAAKWDSVKKKYYVDTNLPIEPLRITKDMTLAAKKTSKASFSGNLKSDVGFRGFEITLRDDDDNSYDVKVIFKRSGDISDSTDPFNENQRYTFEVYVNGSTTPDATGHVVLDKFGEVVDAQFDTGGTDREFDVTGGTTTGATLVITNTGQFKFYEADDPANFVVPDYTHPTYRTAVTTYDSLGNPYQVYFEFIKLGYVDDQHKNVWIWKAYIPSGEEISYGVDSSNPDVADAIGGAINFDEAGRIKDYGAITGSTTADLNWNDDHAIKYIKFSGADNGDGQVGITLNMNNVTQFTGNFSAIVDSQDGYPAGVLDSFAINEKGELIGTFTNGVTTTLGKVALATFRNPAGLYDVGKSLYVESENSGMAEIGVAGENGKGSLIPGALEMSNVDLAEEFTKMIIAQRGFQANARVVTTSDQILNELVNIKR